MIAGCYSYGDHAANERTFLAWVRTAVATMAFGFLVEKFDLFLEVASVSLGGRAPSPTGQVVGNVAGLALIVLGGAMIVLAAIRFRRTARDIDSATTVRGSGVRLGLLLTGLLLLLGAVLFGYLLYTVLRRF